MRRTTKQVKVGNIYIGSDYPIRVQSMLNTDTMDTEACVEQAIRIIEAGGELVRITAQGVKEAENLKNIHQALRKRGYDTPLSADIHFNSEAAIVAAKYVEKVRINPGNFADKRATFKNLIYTDEEYAEEIIRLKDKFILFLNVCKKYGTAIRIGTNHGSLSDRIMSRYGNTPEGMVEATMEYLRICKDYNFNDVIISLKSSDCRIMVDAVRKLVKRMDAEAMNYPLHLGVTEAGEGEDGRIRSAIGIGTLLNEGLGDTIRVSLTEEPECEIPVAKTLVDYSHPELYMDDGCELPAKESHPVIIGDISYADYVSEKLIHSMGFKIKVENDPVNGDILEPTMLAPEIVYTESLGPELTKLTDIVTVIVPYYNIDVAHVYNRSAKAYIGSADFLRYKDELLEYGVYLEISNHEILTEELIETIRNNEQIVFVLAPEKSLYSIYKNILTKLSTLNFSNKIIIKIPIDDNMERMDNMLHIASNLGGLFLDRLVYGLWLSDSQNINESMQLSRDILQSAGVRRYKTDFISCPGCGRTLFNLQESVRKVKSAFSHLSKLKIGVMGCVVNGPGEMGDADYGYVGAGNGKVNLYKGQQMVKAAIPEEQAIQELEYLIKENGDWE